MATIKAFVMTTLELDPEAGLRYACLYRLTEPAGQPPTEGGTAYVIFDSGKTETETNAEIQQAVADHARKTAFVVSAIGNDRQIRDDLSEQLAAYLSTQYAPAEFRARDIVGYSVSP